MSKSICVESIPNQVKFGLIKLGTDLRIARERRNESLRSFAKRILVSVPTLMRMEKGDPTVGVATYAVAIWALGKIELLINLMDPLRDEQAILLEVAKSSRAKKGANYQQKIIEKEQKQREEKTSKLKEAILKHKLAKENNVL